MTPLELQAVVNEIKGLIVLSGIAAGPHDRWVINKLEAAIVEAGKSPAQAWIPCSERLPENPPIGKSAKCLVTFDCEGDRFAVKVFEYWEPSYDFSKRFTAWMPLPEPYRP